MDCNLVLSNKRTVLSLYYQFTRKVTVTMKSIFKDKKNVTIIKDFDHTYINWIGVNVGDTETKFLDNICFLEKLVRDQNKKPNS